MCQCCQIQPARAVFRLASMLAFPAGFGRRMNCRISTQYVVLIPAPPSNVRSKGDGWRARASQSSSQRSQSFAQPTC